jgi:hypothetical protein
MADQTGAFMTVLRYQCSCCGQWREGIPDITFDRPLQADEIPIFDHASRLKLSSDFCSIDTKSFFIRCVLPIPKRGTDKEFCWGVWSSLSQQNFKHYWQTYDDDQSRLEPMFGWLSNRLPLYSDTVNLKLSVQPQANGHRPRLTLEPTDHPLAIEQREGITLERLGELAALLHQNR